VLLRFPSIYGLGSPHKTHVEPAIRAAMRGATIRFDSGGGAYRDYLYVKDVAASIAAALTTPAERLSQRLFFVATGTLSSAADLGRIIEELYPGCRVVVGPGQTPLEARAAPIRVAYDVTRARLVLGFTPQYDLRAGIIDYGTMLGEFLAQHCERLSSTSALSKEGLT
jgi:nucleoside-diphosphate-sugar epimerase